MYFFWRPITHYPAPPALEHAVICMETLKHLHFKQKIEFEARDDMAVDKQCLCAATPAHQDVHIKLVGLHPYVVFTPYIYYYQQTI